MRSTYKPRKTNLGVRYYEYKEPEWCCTEMNAAWSVDAISFGSLEPLYNIRAGGLLWVIRFCPFCGSEIVLTKTEDPVPREGKNG